MINSIPKTLSLPELPLLLWQTPPGLELALGQEGVPFRRVRHFHPLSFQSGRVVLFDSRKANVLAGLSLDHVAIDVAAFQMEDHADPLAALVDNRAGKGVWDLGDLTVSERVGRVDKRSIRRRLASWLRNRIAAAGGVWAQLSAFPFPYRSAFNFRADLDETNLDDYTRFARARIRLADCFTHFVSTRAYGQQPDVLEDLRWYDTQSHGHHHVIYRDQEANRRNLQRADQLLREAGFTLSGFAAPHGRWNPGLDQVLEELGYLYSSDFQLGYDDVPFYPWQGDRFSGVLQVPIHPICEGIFFEAGETSGRVVADHLARVVRAKIEAGEPAFVYGHPEGRLARHPEILETVADAVEGNDLLWRVTLSEFARWWRWRLERSWSMVPRADGTLEVQFDEWSSDFPLCLEIYRGRHVARVPLAGPRTTLRIDGLAYEPIEPIADIARPRFLPTSSTLRGAVRRAIDWETVTPLEELPTNTLSARVKKELRRLRQSRNDSKLKRVTS